MRPLKIGIFLPTFEGADSQGPGWTRNGVFNTTTRWSELRALASRIEAVGFDSIWVPDHLLFRWEGAGGPSQGTWDGWSILAALAAVTRRVELGTLVLSTAFRNPALLAKMADTVDEISDGRLVLGLGAGYHEPEFRAFGYPFDHRGSRFEEALTIIAGLLRDGEIDFEGRYVSAPDCVLRPRARRRGGPPIMVAGGDQPGPRTVRLAVERADLWNNWLAFGRSYPDALVRFREQVDAACEVTGRDPATLGRTASIMIVPPGQESLLLDPDVEPLSGNAQEIADAFHAFAAEGIEHLQLILNPCSEASVEALAPVLNLLDRNDDPMPKRAGA